MTVRVHRSNRLESLLDPLSRLLQDRPAAPHEPETIVVQSLGMERWLSLELTRRFGVWAHARFPFPRHFLEECATCVLGPPPAGSDLFDPACLQWAVAAELPQIDEAAGKWEDVRGYLTADRHGIKRFDLAAAIAETLDRYVIYRPELLYQWQEKPPPDNWQAQLWHRLRGRLRGEPLCARLLALLQRLEHEPDSRQNLPRRALFFGISTLPPLIVETLYALGRYMDVHLFVLSPSRQFWADVRSKRAILKEAIRWDVSPEEAAFQLHLEEGHPLLASLGKLERHFQQLLEAMGDYEEGEEDDYCDPGAKTLLAALQSDILHLRRRGGAAEPPRISAEDRSLTVHSCHGVLREVEVLFEELRLLFDQDPSLAPHDVVVLTPSIEEYVPAVEAVFGQPDDDAAAIPWTVADRSPRLANSSARAFLRALDVAAGRLEVNEVIDLASLEPVRRNFDLSSADLERLRRWLEEVGVRWGADGDHRRREGAGAERQNTWAFGLDRLLMGYAVDPDAVALTAGVAPYDDVEGSGVEVLAKLARLWKVLDSWRREVASERPPAEWREHCRRFIADLLGDDDETGEERVQLLDAIDEWASTAEAADFHEPISVAVMRRMIARVLDRRRPARGFLRGAVTFCELVPLRAIPFRVVCLLGMNDGAFPRPWRPYGFDVTARKPRLGDRNPRDEDRSLFLESLLAARDRFIVTYQGRNLQDNREQPPSAVLAELLDVVESDFRAADGTSAAEFVLRRHRRQRFHPSYFRSDDAGRSSSPLAAAAAAALCGPREAPVMLVRKPLASQEEDTVSVTDLCSFFRDPARWFLQRRLQIRLPEPRLSMPSLVPLSVDPLTRWRIGDQLVRLALEADSPEEGIARGCAILRASGEIPPGPSGDLLLKQVAEDARVLAQYGRRLRGQAKSCLHREQVISLGESGSLLVEQQRVWDGPQVAVTVSKEGKAWELERWIRHLALNATLPDDESRESLIVCRPDKSRKEQAVCIRFVRVRSGEARAELAKLVRLFRAGQTEPLPFLRDVSRKVAESLSSTPASESPSADRVRRAVAEARAEYERSGEGSHDQRARAAFELAFRGVEDPFDQPRTGRSDANRFADVARTVFGPLLEHRQREELDQ